MLCYSQRRAISIIRPKLNCQGYCDYWRVERRLFLKHFAEKGRVTDRSEHQGEGTFLEEGSVDGSLKGLFSGLAKGKWPNNYHLCCSNSIPAKLNLETSALGSEDSNAIEYEYPPLTPP